jgi:carbonic anhydrase
MSSAAPSITPDEALQRLIDGNARFVGGQSAQQSPARDWLKDLVGSQNPFATILGCSDSRVPPEIVFDQGLGDLFIVRVAGNVVSAEILGSLGYALEHLRTPLFVVLGHERCGAVQAALQTKFHQAEHPEKIADLLNAMLPGLDAIDPNEPEEIQWLHGVEANVRWALHQLAATPAGAAAIAERRIKLVGAIYELATGRIRFLPEKPASAGAAAKSK